MAVVLSIAHMTGCIWWGVGTRSQVEPTWVRKFNYEEQPVDAQYFVSLHWAIAQFTGGMDEVSPAAAVERFYAVVVWTLAFFVAATVISIITSHLTQDHIIKGSRSRQISTLKKYLRQHGISSNLSMRMQRSANHALSADLTEDVVELLPVVSEPLRIEMHFVLYSQVIRMHPFFASFIDDAPHVMRRVCHFAMANLMFSAGDTIFSRGETPQQPKMYFVIAGNLEYQSALSGSEGSETICDGESAAEPVLWTRWTHQGSLTALVDSKLATLDAKAFQEITDRFKDLAMFDPKLYANDFVDSLNSSEPGKCDDLFACEYKWSLKEAKKNKFAKSTSKKL
jgi:hypothetical protein